MRHRIRLFSRTAYTGGVCHATAFLLNVHTE